MTSTTGQGSEPPTNLILDEDLLPEPDFALDQLISALARVHEVTGLLSDEFAPL